MAPVPSQGYFGPARVVFALLDGSDDGNISWEEFEELEKCPRRMIGKCLKGGRWGGCVSYWDTVITSKRWVGKWREDIVDVIVYDDAPSGTGPRKRAE